MEISARELHGFTVVDVVGRVTDDDAAPLRQRVEKAIDGGSHDIAISLARVSHITSHAIGSLIHIWKKIGQLNGNICLISGQSSLDAQFDSYNLRAILTIHESEEEFAEFAELTDDTKRIPDLRDKGPYKIVDVDDRFGIVANPGYVNALLEEVLQGGHRHVALNLTPVKKIYSPALAVFLQWEKKLREAEGSLSIFGLDKAQSELFDYAGLYGVMKIYDTENDLPQTIS